MKKRGVVQPSMKALSFIYLSYAQVSWGMAGSILSIGLDARGASLCSAAIFMTI